MAQALFGLGVIAALRALGIECHITVSEPVALNRSEALAKGADETVDPESESLYERAMAITGGPSRLTETLCRRDSSMP